MSSHLPPPNFPSRRELHQKGTLQGKSLSNHDDYSHNRDPNVSAESLPYKQDSQEDTTDRSQNPFVVEKDACESGKYSRPKNSRNSGGRKIGRGIRSLLVLILVLALLCVGLWIAFNVTNIGSRLHPGADDYLGPGTGKVSVTVEPGDTGSVIGQKLKEAGVVKTSDAFTRAFQSNKAATSIKPGTYALKEQMAAGDAINELLNDKNRSDNVITVIPGATYWQVATELEKVSHFSSKDIQAAIDDATSLGLPASAKGNIEGWLLPGSYEFVSSDTPRILLQKMISGRVSQLDNLKIPDKDRETVLTKASIIEREVHLDEYYPKVARVIDNRLDHPEGETKGRLQMDSTVLYGLHRAGGMPTSSEVKDPQNPYNTYQNAGLPPTPIGTPSEAAIQAVLQPGSGSWLYFVTVDLDSGETLFSSTSEEQAQNIKKLNRYCSAHSDKCNK